MSLSAGPFSPI